MLATVEFVLVMKPFALCMTLGIGSVLFASTCAREHDSAEATFPKDASTAAQKLLDLMLEEVRGDPSHRWAVDGVIQDGKAHLGEPFLGYQVGPDSLAAYAGSAEDDLRLFARDRGFYFPVISGGRWTILIIVTKGHEGAIPPTAVSGEFVAGRGPHAPGSPTFFDWAIELASEYRPSDGCDVALINARTEVPHTDGRFLFRKCQDQPGMLTATDDRTLGILPVKALGNGRYEFVPINEAVRPLKQRLRGLLIDETYTGVENTRAYMRRGELTSIRSRPDLIRLDTDFRYPYLAYPDTIRKETFDMVVTHVLVVGPKMSRVDALKVLDEFPTRALHETSGSSEIGLSYWRPYGKNGYIRVEGTGSHFH